MLWFSQTAGGVMAHNTRREAIRRVASAKGGKVGLMSVSIFIARFMKD